MRALVFDSGKSQMVSESGGLADFARHAEQYGLEIPEAGGGLEEDSI